MPTYGIEPQTRIYKIRVIPLNYAGSNARGNRTLVPCVKGKCINRYTIASECNVILCLNAKDGIEPPTSDHETDMLPLHYLAFTLQASGLEPENQYDSPS